MTPGPPRRRRARPVADAPVDALLARSEDLAKGWLIALLEQMPLEESSAILGTEVARDAPRVCDAAIRALADENDLRRLQAGGALELLVAQTGALAGARSAEATSRAVDALRAVLWSALHEELRQADAEQVGELAERLALVIELIRGAALRHATIPASRSSPRPNPLRGERAGILRQAFPPVEMPSRPTMASTAAFDRVHGGESAADPLAAVPPADGAAPLWLGAVDDEIGQAQANGMPLSLLLIELEDAARVQAVEQPADVTATFGRFAQAVRTVLRRQDILACESETRAWIIARDTGRLGAQALGARIAAAVRAAPPWRGAPLSVSVGLAVLGEDGTDRAGMIEAAEESRFAAEASGAGIATEPD